MITTQGEIVNKRNAKALYEIAKHFDVLLMHNGASWNERLQFAKGFLSGNGLYIPDFEIKAVDAVKTIELFVDECIKEPTPAREAYNSYREWSIDNGVEPLFKQRFLAVVREVAIVKSTYKGKRNVIFATYEAVDNPKISAIDSAKEFIITALNGGRMQVSRLNELAYRSGISEATFKRAKNELDKENIVRYIKKGHGKCGGITWFLALNGETEN